MSSVEFNSLESFISGCTNAVVSLGHPITRSYRDQLAYLKANPALHERATALMEEFAEYPVCVANMPALTAHVAAVLQATTASQMAQATTRFANAVHGEQEQLATIVAPRIQAATHLTSFAQVKQLRTPGRVVIIGEQDGKALQTEILTPPGKPLTIRTETLGFRDDTCTATLDEFREHLKQQGVTLETTQRVSTLRQRVRSRLGVRQ
jgi:cysteinyl-tRNA synthetase